MPTGTTASRVLTLKIALRRLTDAKGKMAFLDRVRTFLRAVAQIPECNELLRLSGTFVRRTTSVNSAYAASWKQLSSVVANTCGQRTATGTSQLSRKYSAIYRLRKPHTADELDEVAGLIDQACFYVASKRKELIAWKNNTETLAANARLCHADECYFLLSVQQRNKDYESTVAHSQDAIVSAAEWLAGGVGAGMANYATQEKETTRTKLQPTKPKKKRGGQPKRDPKYDKKIHAAWKSGRHTDYTDLANAMGLEYDDVKKAIDSHRKRLPKS